MTERVRIHVRGRVQGVGFRYFVVDAARRAGVTGFVHNEPDGSVLCEAQGEAGVLRGFVADVRRGPRFSRVDVVESEAVDAVAGESGFEVRR